MLVKKNIEYHDQDVVLQGYYVFDDAINGARPLVTFNHDWSGLNDLARQRVEQLAKLGYVGFAIDMFGKGVLGKTTEEKSALITPFLNDRDFLLRRLLAGFNIAKQLDHVDASRTAALGICFGGLCVLDLARSGTDVNGVVSFHGLFNAPEHKKDAAIKAKVLALHGHDDPMCTPEQVLAFETEMTKAKVDWQVHVYGNTTHAFSNPLANDPKLGTVYNPVAEKRSWISMKNFLEEIL